MKSVEDCPRLSMASQHDTRGGVSAVPAEDVHKWHIPSFDFAS